MRLREGEADEREYLLESNNVVSWLDRCDALADRLYNSSSLMSKHDGEGSLGILSGECVRICSLGQTRSRLLS
jgi:hypothetical protein